jgi:hypothetical protein
MIEGAPITYGIVRPPLSNKPQMIAYWVDFGLFFTDPNPIA